MASDGWHHEICGPGRAGERWLLLASRQQLSRRAAGRASAAGGDPTVEPPRRPDEDPTSDQASSAPTIASAMKSAYCSRCQPRVVTNNSYSSGEL